MAATGEPDEICLGVVEEVVDGIEVAAKVSDDEAVLAEVSIEGTVGEVAGENGIGLTILFVTTSDEKMVIGEDGYVGGEVVVGIDVGEGVAVLTESGVEGPVWLVLEDEEVVIVGGLVVSGASDEDVPVGEDGEVVGLVVLVIDIGDDEAIEAEVGIEGAVG